MPAFLPGDLRVQVCGWGRSPSSGLGKQSANNSLLEGAIEPLVKVGGLSSQALPRVVGQRIMVPPHQTSDSLLCYKDVGPDLIHLIPGSLLAVLGQGPLQVQDAGSVVQAGVIHLFPDTVVQVLHKQLLGRLQHAWTLCLSFEPPRLEFYGDKEAFSSKRRASPAPWENPLLAHLLPGLCVWAEFIQIQQDLICQEGLNGDPGGACIGLDTCSQGQQHRCTGVGEGTSVSLISSRICLKLADNFLDRGP